MTQTPTMIPPAATAPRRVRSDAVRNRSRVLEAARTAFQAEGLAVNMDVIARRAGVGVGTVYRHFPTKEALFEAIVLSDLEAFAREGRALVDSEKPGEALYGFLQHLVDHSETSMAVKDALGGVFAIGRYAADAIREIEEVVGALLVRAQQAGETRSDVNASELLALLAAAYHAANPHSRGTASCQRLVSVICDGLRTPAAHA